MASVADAATTASRWCARSRVVPTAVGETHGADLVWPKTELVRCQRDDQVRRDGGTLVGRGLRRLAQSFGGRHHGGKAAAHLLEAHVRLAPNRQPTSGRIEFDLARPSDKGETEQFGKFGADLPGVGIDRVEAAQDEVERAVTMDRDRQCASCRERVAAGERRIAHVHAAGRAAGDHLAHGVLGAGWSHREHDDLAIAVRPGRPLWHWRDGSRH